MDGKKSLRCFSCLTVLLVVALPCVFVVQAPAGATEPVPRILLAGDSWTGFMLAFQSFRTVLPDYGLERWVEVGNRTAEMGGRAYEMLERDYLDVLTDELTRYPNIDVVVMTLGGNDILRGTKGVLSSDPETEAYHRRVSIRNCFRDESWATWSDPIECLDWLAMSVRDQVNIMVDHMLALRPDIRIVILSYDFAAREPRDSEYNVLQQHEAFVAVQERMRELALFNDRVEFVMNFGLMQSTYGIPSYLEQGLDEPRDGYPMESIDAGDVPPPCNSPGDTNCGGLPAFLSPLFAYIDEDIHLTDFGYALIAQRAIEAHVEEWLNYPKVLEILPLDTKAPLYQFQVTFSHPVVGVTLDDFEVFVEDKSGLKSMAVVGVQPASGPSDTYTVTVDMAGSQQAAFILVQDDDSITRADTGVALGGPGTGNGYFEYNGAYEFVDIPEPDDDDFAGALQFLYMASQAYEYLLAEVGFSFNPEHFDANGNLFQDGSMDDPITIPGNGILDLHEFMVIDAILKRPDLDLSATGGVTYEAVKAAWDKNIACVQTALGGVGGLADIILPGIDTVLAGFYTIGDQHSTLLVITLLTLLGTVDEFPTNVNTNALFTEPHEHLPGWLAFSGDASGNGWTNDQIYAYFGVDGVDAYVNAVLDPNVAPVTGEGVYREGDFVRIAVLDRPKYDSSFEWFRNGEPLQDKSGRIVGAESRTLDILALAPGDSGAYTCVYTQPNKVGGVYPQATYGPVTVTVRAGALSVSGMGALAMTAALLASLGLGKVRRKDAPRR